ncbi:MAG: AAA family ATPase [Acidobacteria bacterium]|nr:AAA family ATPase [Acidobacteriota bacterium]
MFVRRVVLKNYKSIASCDVRLCQLTFLVGPNGAGKSNFVDGLRFVTDSLRTSLDHALRDRGGVKEVRRRSGGHPTHFGIRLELVLEGQPCTYAFRVGAKPNEGYEVQHEECSVGPHHVDVRSGRVNATISTPPAALPDRLYLVNVSGLPEFRPLYDALSNMGFYNLNPDRIRELQSPDPGQLLLRDGSNVATVVARLSTHSKKTKKRIEEYLGKVVPGLVGVDERAVGPKETLEFRQRVAGAKDPWRFFAANMSDGTLRALGILVAIFQSANLGGPRIRLVAIEEPEVALHPAAAGVLRDSLRDASRTTQLIVTSQSPDLLDDDLLDPDSILAVVSEDGATKIGPLDEVGKRALRERLYTPGELLRMNQLMPDTEELKRAEERVPSLFSAIDD